MKIKKEELLRVPIHVLKDILEKGYGYIHIYNGRSIKVTKKDLLFDADEIEKALKEEKNK
jgi:hypothetical protein